MPKPPHPGFRSALEYWSNSTADLPSEIPPMAGSAKGKFRRVEEWGLGIVDSSGTFSFATYVLKSEIRNHP